MSRGDGYLYRKRQPLARDDAFVLVEKQLGAVAQQIPQVALACLRQRHDAHREVRRAIDLVDAVRQALADLEEQRQEQKPTMTTDPRGGEVLAEIEAGEAGIAQPLSLNEPESPKSEAP